MRRLVTMLALLSSLASFVVIAGGGLTLVAIEVSGERGMGALMAIGGALAFVAVMALIFVRHGAFGEGAWNAMAIAAAIVGALPPAALAYASIRFAGLPLRSPMPIVDWTVLFVGILFGLGAVSVLALGHRRSQERAEAGEEAGVVHIQQIRGAQQQLRSAFQAETARRAGGDDFDDEIRVRRV